MKHGAILAPQRACMFALLPLLMALIPVQATGQAPPVPQSFQDLYNSLNSDIVNFNTTLGARWSGSKYPVLFASNLTDADSNTGPLLINPGYLQTVQNEIQALKAIGVQAIVVNVSFPMLYQPFFSSQSQYQQYVTFYGQVAAAVRAAGLKLIVENQCLANGLVESGFSTAPFYASLTWSQYQAARAQTALVIAQTMQPDYFIASEEPDSESTMSGQSSVNTVAGSTSMLDQILTSLQQSGVAGMKVGAGVGAWLNGFQGFISSYTMQQCAAQPCLSTPLDFIDMHVYPINNWGPPPANDFMANALTIAAMAAAAGKPVTMAQCWEWKVRNSEWNLLTYDQIMARNPFSFWAPLDAYFLQTMVNFANYAQMTFMAPFDSQLFTGYLTYGSATQNLTPAQLWSQELAQAAQGLQQASYTSTALAYYAAIIPSPDTTPPSTPTLLTAVSQSPTGTAFSWTAATDNVGVAGYNITRNGVTIATTIATLYTDLNLAQNTAYTYAVSF
jgi:hypothetical protein